MITIMKPIIAIIKMKNMITAKIIITIMIIAIIIAIRKSNYGQLRVNLSCINNSNHWN